MPYREELAAAHAQIVALERKLAGLQDQPGSQQKSNELTQRLAQERRNNEGLQHSMLEQTQKLAEARQLIQQHEKTIFLLEQRPIQLAEAKKLIQQKEETIQELTLQTRQLAEAKQQIKQHEKTIFMLQQLANTPKINAAPNARGVTLTEHNRTRVPSQTTKGLAGVLCPRCFTYGERIELRYTNCTENELKEVFCTSCSLHDWMKP